MLIVSRKAGESILIGNDIEVFILEAQGDRIRIGIEAPKSISIIRKELKIIYEENIQAVNKTDLGNIKKLTDLMQKQKNIEATKLHKEATDI